VPEELEEVFDRVQFWGIGRQEEQRDVVGEVEIVGGIAHGEEDGTSHSPIPLSCTVGCLHAVIRPKLTVLMHVHTHVRWRNGLGLDRQLDWSSLMMMVCKPEQG